MLFPLLPSLFDGRLLLCNTSTIGTTNHILPILCLRRTKAIYESWPGAKKLCIGEKSGNYGYGHPYDKSYWWMNDVEIPFMYVEYEHGHAKAYLHCKGVGRDDIDALLKIVNLEEEEYGLYKEPLVKFRKGPGVENALWWIDTWGTEWKDEGCEWYFDTKAPTVVPTARPTKRPTKEPTTKKPTKEPTAAPTAAPSPVPSADPTLSSAPSAVPSISAAPSAGPSSAPSAAPSVSAAPSAGPSSAPSAMPSVSAAPSAGPSASPSSWPSRSPSSPPSISSAPSCRTKSCKSSRRIR